MHLIHWRKGLLKLTFFIKNGDISYNGSILFMKLNQNNMKIRQPKIESLPNELKSQQSKSQKKHWYLIKITFISSTFYRRLESITEYYEILTSNKINISGKSSNKNWWSLLSPKGKIEINPSKEIIEIILIIETKAKIDVLDFKERVKKIVPYFEINIGYKDPKEYEYEKEFEKSFFPENQSNKIIFKRLNY
jgi:hypothetical protein